jgi:hypothetical protein
MEPHDIASYLDIDLNKVQRYLDTPHPPPRNSVALRMRRMQDAESPFDISGWEKVLEGGVVRWRKPE